MDECQVLGVCFSCEPHDILQESIRTRAGHIFGVEPLLEAPFSPISVLPSIALRSRHTTLPCASTWHLLGLPDPFCLQV